MNFRKNFWFVPAPPAGAAFYNAPPGGRNEFQEIGSKMRRGRAKRVFLAGLGLCLSLAGCAQVDPRSDYRRANELIAERTGIADTYDPATEELVQAKVDALLADGLTVEEAVRVALLNNRGFQALFAEIGASRAEVVQSGLLTNPALSLNGMFPEGGGRAQLNLGFAQQIADLWQIPVRRKAAEAELERTILTAARQALDLAADAKIRCYRVLALQQAQSFARESLKLANEGVQLALAQLAAGKASQLDVNLTRANAIEANLELLDLEREQRVAVAELARVLGLGRRSGAWTLQDELPPVGDPPRDLDALVSAALERRFDLRAAEARAAAGEAEWRLELAKIFPDVALGFDLERPEARAIPGRDLAADTARASLAAGQLAAPEIESRGRRRIEKAQIIDAILGPSLALALPLWDQNQARIAKARFRFLQFCKAQEDLREAAARDVRRAAAQVQGAAELVRYYEQEALPQASETVTNATKLYEAGQKDIWPLLESERSLLARRLAYVNMRRDYAIALVELENAVGGRLPPSAAAPSATTVPSPVSNRP